VSATPVIYPFASTRATSATFARTLTYGSIMVADLIAFLMAGTFSVMVRYVFHGRFAPSEYLSFLPSIAVLFVVFAIGGLYPGIAINPIEEFRRSLRSVSVVFLIVIGTTYFLREGLSSSRLVYLLAWLLTLLLVPTSRRVIRGWCSFQNWWGIPAIILGEPEVAETILDILQTHPRMGLRPVAILYEEDPDYRPGAATVGGVFAGDFSHSDLLARDYPNCYAILANPKHLSTCMMEAAEMYSRVIVIPDMFGVNSLFVRAKDIGGLLALEVNPQLTRVLPQIVKRLFDLTIGVGVCLILSPLLTLLYLAVRLTSAGPAFYGHRRIGRGNQEFTVWKFRTMAVDADTLLEHHLEQDSQLRDEWERNHKLKCDPRVTLVGRFLRKTSLDELPQLWNVLRGEMSLVGPRPIIRSEVERYGKFFRQYCRVTPGVTGLWQVSGRNLTTYKLRTQIDDYYVRNWGISLDLYILLRTLKTVLLTEGAY
jgi:Undecaprenyl-phosphate galactose phosphotransferase WbaP